MKPNKRKSVYVSFSLGPLTCPCVYGPKCDSLTQLNYHGRFIHHLLFHVAFIFHHFVFPRALFSLLIVMMKPQLCTCTQLNVSSSLSSSFWFRGLYTRHRRCSSSSSSSVTSAPNVISTSRERRERETKTIC